MSSVNLPDIIDHEGNFRKLGWLEPSSDKKLMRASRTSIQTLRSNNGLSPLIDKSAWVPVDYFTAFGPKLIGNQQSCGGCTGWSCAGATGRQRLMRGMPWVGRLSGAAVYAQINGGRDNGSNIIDAMTAIENIGTCLESEQDFPNFLSLTAAAKADLNYKEDVAITLATSIEAATALQMGILPQLPIEVANNFEKFSGDGVAGLSGARQGNHSIYLCGLEYINGVWYFRMANSWGQTWGPFKDGTVRLTMPHIDNCASAEDGFGHASVVRNTTNTGVVSIPAPVFAI